MLFKAFAIDRNFNQQERGEKERNYSWTEEIRVVVVVVVVLAFLKCRMLGGVRANTHILVYSVLTCPSTTTATKWAICINASISRTSVR